MDNASQEYEWYLARDGQRYGPIAEDDLHQLISKGQLKPEDLVWRKGFPEWVEAKSVPGLLVEQEIEQTVHHSPISSVEQPYDSQSNQYGEQPLHTGSELKAEPVFDQPNHNEIQQDYAEVRPVRRRKSFAKRFFSFVLFLLILGGIGLFALPAVVPADFIREHIARIVKEKTGRTLSVRGKSTFSLVPYLGVKMHDASISNPPDVPGEAFIQASTLEVKLKFWPLLDKKIEVERIILKKPQISLRIDSKGRKNWSFAEAILNDKKKVGLKSLSGKKGPKILAGLLVGTPDSGGDKSFLQNITLKEIDISEGIVTYYDEKSSLSERVNNVTATIALPGESRSMRIKGTGIWRSERVNYTLSLSSPLSMLKGEKVPYDLTLKSRYFSTILNGEMSWADGLYLTGERSELEVRSLRQLAKWLNHEIAPGSGMETFTVVSSFTSQPGQIKLTNTSLTLDDTSASGEVTILVSGKRPYLKARLVSEAVDLSPYFQDTPLNKSSFNNYGFKYAGQSGGNNFRQVNQDNPGTVGSNDQQNNNGSAVEDNLSARPINTFASSLQIFDADIDFTAKKILYENMLIGPSSLNVKIRNGDLSARISKMQLYSGQVTGQFLVSGTGPLPKITADLKISDISSLNFLKSVSGFGWVSGKAAIDLKLSSTGHSKKQILSGLAGKSVLSFTEGAIEGINIPASVKDLKKVISKSLISNTSARTEFKKLTATFTFKQGVARNEDLNLTAKGIRLKGKGLIDFPQGLVDYQIDTRIGKNTSVPLRIKGPLDTPRIKLETIAKNQDAIVRGLNNSVINDPDDRQDETKNKPKTFEDVIKGVLKN